MAVIRFILSPHSFFRVFRKGSPKRKDAIYIFICRGQVYFVPFLTSADGNSLSSLLITYMTILSRYFERNIYKRSSQNIKLTSSVLQKVAEGSLEAKILKTIALIYLVEQFEKLPPIVKYYFRYLPR